MPDNSPREVLPHFDPHDPGLSPERAYATYAQLRRHCPVSHGERHGGYWSIARYADVRDAATDHMTYSSTGGVYLPPVSGSRFPPIDHDPPEHAGFRELIAPLTSGAAAKTMEPAVRAIAERLVDGFTGRGRAELAAELATPLPLEVITRLYDLGPEDTEEIRGYSEEFLTHASGSRGPEIIDRVCRYWVGLFADRRENPREDFLTGLVEANRELGATDDELANMMFILTYAGHDSTALGLGNTLLYLAEHPDVQQRLLDEPKLIPSMIDEILRHETPLHWFPRQLTADTCLHGQQMKAGERVLLLFASANRDPEVFDPADEIVIDRRPNRHLAFGAGIHTCPGMALAKLEIRTAVQVVLERIPGFRVDGDVERTDPLEGGGRHLGVRRLPVTW
ncbi:cytochrome P450 [Pseudonocardia alni]|uniref:Cytochrome P450 n=1 Tax=Pseudonocardia alni TaxID=33907 RepID=A0A852WCA0_PSEA5|nr:cytochrome P450 [Pseudonocardia antarctica]NYG04354.1 cytochrome P450 [Pseudonocardia antarctica]